MYFGNQRSWLYRNIVFHPTAWRQALRKKSSVGLHTVLQWAKYDQILNINCAHNLWFRSQFEQLSLLEVLIAEPWLQSRVKGWIICVRFANGLGFGSISSRWTWPFAFDCSGILLLCSVLWCPLALEKLFWVAAQLSSVWAGLQTLLCWVLPSEISEEKWAELLQTELTTIGAALCCGHLTRVSRVSWEQEKPLEAQGLQEPQGRVWCNE